MRKGIVAQLIVGRVPLDMIDNHGVDRHLLGFEFKPELFLDRHEKARA